MLRERCPEPDGNREPQGTGYETAHELMVDQGGMCPWCGELKPGLD